MKSHNPLKFILSLLIVGTSLFYGKMFGQNSMVEWIRPDQSSAPALWGIKGGIVIGLWPTAIENKEGPSSGGPRGLMRMGYEFMGKIYQLNFIAIEPLYLSLNICLRC